MIYISHVSFQPKEKPEGLDIFPAKTALVWSKDNGLGVLIALFEGLGLKLVEVIESGEAVIPALEDEDRVHYDKAVKDDFALFIPE